MGSRQARTIKNYIPIGILIFLWVVTRFYKLRSGLHLLEPDEWEYLQIADSLKGNWYPVWHGKSYFLQIPLFPILAHWVDWGWVREVWGHFGSVRLVSVLASGVYYLWVYKITEELKGKRAAWWTMAIWLITPLFWFYSRQGTTDMLALALAWGGVYLWLEATKYQISNIKYQKLEDKIYRENHNERTRLKYAVLAGVFLGVAVLAKTNAVVFWSLPGLWLLFELVENIRIGNFSTPPVQRLKNIKLALTTLVSGGMVIGMAVIPLILIFKQQFWEGISTHPSLFLVINPRANLALLYEYIKTAPWWLGWGVVGMGIIGVIGLIGEIKKVRKTKIMSDSHGIALSPVTLKSGGVLTMTVVTLGIGQIFLLGWWYFSARNFLLAASGGFLLIAVGVDWILEKLKNLRTQEQKDGELGDDRRKIAASPRWLSGFLAMTIFWVGALLAGLKAWEATQHMIVEESLEWVRENNEQEWPVYTTFDAEKLTEIGGYEVDWLSEEFEKPAWIITDKEKTGRISSLSFETFVEAKKVVKEIKENYEPVKIWVDEKSLFPVGKTNDVISVYGIE